MDVAKGEYLTFCDSDDYVASNWLEVLMEGVRQYPTALVTVNFTRDDLPETAGENIVFTPVTYFELFKTSCSPYVGNKIYSRKKIETYGLRFREDVVIAEDVEFNCRYLRCCDSIVYTSTPVYLYRRSPESAMNRKYADLLGMNLMPFWNRLAYISDAEQTEYCDIWLYYFMCFLDNIWDSAFRLSFWKKMQYNQRMVCTKEFQYCVHQASGQKESGRLVKCLRQKNYYMYWTIQKLAALRRG